ncbi:BEN domain-containing protein 6-like [Engraulis encrasicolus]
MVIGEGIVVKRAKVMRCNHSSPSKLVCDLLSVLYTRRELATMSLTGQKGSAKEAVKPPLPPNALNAIFDYTLQKFPGADVATLRGAIRNKLNNESKVFKK